MTIPATAASHTAERESAAAMLEASARQARPALKAGATEARQAEVEEVLPPQPVGKVTDIGGSFLIGSVRVQFDFDRDLGELIARVIDPDSGDLIRQVPSEEAVQVAKVLGKLQGLLVQRTA